MDKELITDKEWQQYLEEEHSNYEWCKPKKEDVEKFLRWRQKRHGNRKVTTWKAKET